VSGVPDRAIREARVDGHGVETGWCQALLDRYEAELDSQCNPVMITSHILLCSALRPVEGCLPNVVEVGWVETRADRGGGRAPSISPAYPANLAPNFVPMLELSLFLREIEIRIYPEMWVERAPSEPGPRRPPETKAPPRLGQPSGLGDAEVSFLLRSSRVNPRHSPPRIRHGGRNLGSVQRSPPGFEILVLSLASLGITIYTAFIPATINVATTPQPPPNQ
jgi:hypothetical protein